ncbi:hypothetical protein PYK79_54810, partial [Streptomyces sp. ID05-04B]|nr:hypothetical protein [Streptomyces sp. ID05-04B]
MTDHQHAADAVPDGGAASDAAASSPGAPGAAGESPRAHGERENPREQPTDQAQQDTAGDTRSSPGPAAEADAMTAAGPGELRVSPAVSSVARPVACSRGVVLLT